MITSGNTETPKTASPNEGFDTNGFTSDIQKPVDPRQPTYGYGNNSYGFSNATAAFDNPTAPKDDFKQSQEQAKYLQAKVTAFVDTHGGIHFLIILVSLLLLIKASSDVHKDTNHDVPGYGFAVFLSLMSLLLSSLHYYSQQRNGMLTDSMSLVVILVIFVLWLLAVGVLTFGEAYNVTGNGYFFSWVGFFLSFKLLLDQVKLTGVSNFIQGVKSYGPQLGTLLIASIVLFFSSLSPCKNEDGNGCSGSTLFALLMGIISTVFVLLFYKFGEHITGKVRLVVLGANMILWIFVAIFGTFDKPFLTTGNGYFACWIGLVASVLLFTKAMRADVAVIETKNVDMV